MLLYILVPMIQNQLHIFHNTLLRNLEDNYIEFWLYRYEDKQLNKFQLEYNKVEWNEWNIHMNQRSTHEGEHIHHSLKSKIRILPRG